MRIVRLVLAASIAVFLSSSLVAQQTSTSSTQALTLLQKSLAALSGAISDVTLSGTARRTEPIEIHYDDYRNVAGILIPFHVTYFVRGQVRCEYQIQFFTMNQGAQPTDFELR
jgi:hypothetical protein